MAKTLADAGIDTIVIADSAAFALMARVNKVLLPAHSVLANGGLITASGCNLVALAADYNTVPVVCITGMFKLCPMYPHEGQDTLNDMVSPSTLMDYSEMSDDLMSNVEVINNIRDYIAPKLVSLYVTNVGSFPPSYIYRLLAEYYHSDDWDSLE
jgi:translation initiation factor eIF-2B subunit beta